MGPGTSFTNTATIRVPGSTVGNQRWEVKTNTAGDIFEGQNTNNNTATSLATVAIDVQDLIVGSAPLTNTFTSAGQSWWYKLNPGTGQTIGVNLALTGNSGAVQLFVGEGYVPDAQNFDMQQVQWNSPNVSLNIPNTTSQTYYLTAVAQNLVSNQAPFTISAVAQRFSLTSVSPNTIVNSGTAQIEFIGAQLNSGATYQLINQNGTAYTATSIYVNDSSHVNAIFNALGIPAGTYNAVVIENGLSVSLANAVQVTNPVLNPSAIYGGCPTTGYTILITAPWQVRAGYTQKAQIHYQNCGTQPEDAPLIFLTSSNATTTQIPPTCSACSPKFNSLFTSLAGQQEFIGYKYGAPAGELKPGDQFDIFVDFTANQGASSVTFNAYTVGDPNQPINWNSGSMLLDSVRRMGSDLHKLPGTGGSYLGPVQPCSRERRELSQQMGHIRRPG
jgi:hypothetical protein